LEDYTARLSCYKRIYVNARAYKKDCLILAF
jgi:hypothetical protein